MEIPENHERRLGELLDGSERLARVGRSFALGLCPTFVDPPQSLGNGPNVQRLAVRACEIGKNLLDSLLLPGHQVNERVARSDENVELLDETGEGGHRGGWRHVASDHYAPEAEAPGRVPWSSNTKRNPGIG